MSEDTEGRAQDRIEELFHELIEISPEDRQQRLQALAESSPAWRGRLEILLRAHERSRSYLVAPRAKAAPTVLGKYRVESELGRGGAGVVYLAEDPDLDRRIAIKVLSAGPWSQLHLERLRSEARTLASVLHPNVAHVYSVETVSDGGQEAAILTMEYVPGVSLVDKIADANLALDPCLDYGRQMAAALEAAHRRGVVHRDLKPANVRIDPEGWIKVLDFGLAAAVSSLAESPAIVGTPGYMSPEQCRGEHATTSSDLWSFGAVLFECLTGKPSVPGASGEDLLERTLRGELRTAELALTLPAPVRVLVERCLDGDPESRPTATEARQILEDELLRSRAQAFLRAIPPDEDGSAPGVEAAARARAASMPGSLPRPLSAFLPRPPLLDLIGKTLAEHSLVTLTGPGGVGKTRTALEVGARRHRDGSVWFVDLAALTPDAEIVAAVARTLRIRDTGGHDDESVLQAIADTLVDSRSLLILDNCEHLLAGAADFVLRLLARAPEARVLATSRQALGLDGEEVVPLPPLAVDGSSRDEASDAVQLFILRARSRSPEFAPKAGELSTVAAICRGLDGLPLAIELAASQARALPLPEILERVLEGRPLPESPVRRVERHRSLDNVVAWSYRMLAPAEAALLRRLAIFRAGCSLGAIESVCGDWGGVERWQVCNLLTRLVERSLVELDLSSSHERSHQPARYRMLETIRLFAAARAEDEPAEQRETLDRYLVHLASWAALRPGEKGPTREARVHRIEPDYSNLINAMELALEEGRLDIAFAIGDGVAHYCVHAGLWVEGLQRMERLLEVLDSKAAAATVEGASEVLIRSQAGLLAGILHRHDRADLILDRAIARGEEVGAPGPLALAYEAAGVSATLRDDLETAQGHFEHCRHLFEEAGDCGAAAVATGNLGVMESKRGRHDEALGYYREYLRLSQEMGDALAQAKALSNIGWTATVLGSYREAESALEEALRIHETSRDLPGTAMSHLNLGHLRRATGDYLAAKNHLIRAGMIQNQIGDFRAFLTSLFTLGQVAQEAERPWLAASIFSRLLDLHEQGHFILQGETLAIARGRLEELRGDPANARIAEWQGRARTIAIADLLGHADAAWEAPG